MLQFQAIKQAKSQKEIPSDDSEFGVPYIIQSTSNNMFARNVNKKWLIDHNEAPVSGNKIVLGVTLPAVSYQPREFGASQVITAKADWMNEKIGNFIALAISKLMYRFSYNQKPGLQIYKNMKIFLPTKNGNIDFALIEELMGTFEAEHILKLESYLILNGLKDYVLNKEEIQVLDEFVNGQFKWKEFMIGNLFDINPYKKRFDANKTIIKNTGKPYVVRTALNNGVRGYIDEDENFLNEGNTISFGQDTATMFYQEKPYFTGDKIKILKYKNNQFNKKNAHFFITNMSKAFSSFSWGRSSFSVTAIKNQKISLPVLNDQPDYEKMNTFISAIKKIAIKPVVTFIDSKLLQIKTEI